MSQWAILRSVFRRSWPRFYSQALVRSTGYGIPSGTLSWPDRAWLRTVEVLLRTVHVLEALLGGVGPVKVSQHLHLTMGAKCW